VAAVPSIRELEERSLNALPAVESEHYDGWILRAAGGYTGRANSAAPLDPGGLEPASKISYTEEWYRSRRLTPMIRLTPSAQPCDLDQLLEERGYSLRDEGVSVQARSLDGNNVPTEAVEVAEGPVPDHWLMTLAEFQPRVGKHIDVVRDLFSRLPLTSAFALIRHEASPASLGRAVVEDGHIGLFDVFTRPDFRGRGLATDITLALLGWGEAQGATHAYLQVVPSNDAAHRLYQRLGFQEAYRYWYRVAPR
jgi:GNAT superfamily N-acetyltransferase